MDWYSLLSVRVGNSRYLIASVGGFGISLCFCTWMKREGIKARVLWNLVTLRITGAKEMREHNQTKKRLRVNQPILINVNLE